MEMTAQKAYNVLTWHHNFIACSSPLPVWTGHGFSFCFQELVFGCAANLVTLFLIGIYNKCYSIVLKQKIKKSAQLFDLGGASWLEMLPFLCALLTTWQGLQVVFGRYDEKIGDYGHTLSYVCLQGLAWVFSCWVLHYDYAVVMADYWYLRLWWLLRPTMHIAYLQSLSKKSKDQFFSKNERLVAMNQRTSFSEVAASLWLSIRLQLLAAFIILFISMMSSWGQQMTSPVKLVTAGSVGLALSYATPMISLLSDLLSTFTETEKEMVSVERINEYMEVKSEQQQAIISLVEAHWPSNGTVEFHNVTLYYGLPNFPALKNVSFVIPGGSQVGIAGRTGAGKSSILNVLFRLMEPNIGFITIDGIDTSKVTLHHLRSNLAVVPQNPFLFEGTIRDNVDIHGISTDQRIWEILEKCHLKQTILSFGGLDTNIKEGGEMLSLGQRQLLCLSRVFVQSTKVICLDECTANVDPQTSWTLQRAISSECYGKTVITIAHRVQSILNLDHVLILENGMLVEEGNPQALLSDQSSRLLSFVKASGI